MYFYLLLSLLVWITSRFTFLRHYCFLYLSNFLTKSLTLVWLLLLYTFIRKWLQQVFISSHIIVCSSKISYKFHTPLFGFKDFGYSSYFLLFRTLYIFNMRFRFKGVRWFSKDGLVKIVYFLIMFSRLQKEYIYCIFRWVEQLQECTLQFLYNYSKLTKCVANFNPYFLLKQS